jgi:hypothetical protein
VITLIVEAVVTDVDLIFHHHDPSEEDGRTIHLLNGVRVPV